MIGGGPIGSYAACKLAETGHSVMVLERKRQVGEAVCCTGIIGQECVNSFGIPEDVILRKANSARLFSPSGNLLRPWREETQACILDRAAFDSNMASQAQSKGAEYMLATQAIDIVFERDRVRVEASRQGEEASFEARAVIIASGFGSRLCERLGLGKAGK